MVVQSEPDKAPPRWRDVLLAALSGFAFVSLPFSVFLTSSLLSKEVIDWLLKLAASVCAVATVALTALFVVTQLSKISGNTKADVTASFRKAGITITVKGAGLFGAFLAVVLWGLVAIYLLTKSN